MSQARCSRFKRYRRCSLLLETYPNFLLALCLWREARGEDRQGKIAVKHVILNRVKRPSGPYASCKDVVSTILCPYQFSTFNHNDPNASQFPRPEDRSWKECCQVVEEQTSDPTAGADHYFVTKSAIPKWADSSKLRCEIGAHSFYRIYL